MFPVEFIGKLDPLRKRISGSRLVPGTAPRPAPRWGEAAAPWTAPTRALGAERRGEATLSADALRRLDPYFEKADLDGRASVCAPKPRPQTGWGWGWGDSRRQIPENRSLLGFRGTELRLQPAAWREGRVGRRRAARVLL